MSDTDEELADQPLWVWDADDPEATPRYFHEYCSLNPLDVTDDVPFMFDFGSEDERFARSVARVFTYAFRHAPLVVIAAVVVLLGQAALGPVNGVEVLLSEEVGIVTLALGTAALLWAAILTLVAFVFSSADGDERLRGMVAELVHAVVVYGVLALLTAGAVWSAWTVYVRPPDRVAPNVLYGFGFLLLVYVGGPLVYDGMCRTETLFTRLDESDVLRTDGDQYREAFLDRFRTAFGLTVGGVPAVLLIGVLFTAQFVAVWVAARGPFVLDLYSSLAIVTLIDVAIVVVAVQFVLLVRFLNELLADSPTTLGYIPGHQDDAGGFRDVGRFATRVNSLLVLAGVYLGYRLHVQGSRDPLSPTTEAVVTAWDPLIWATSYAIPVAVYGVVIGIWLYFSFWQIHRKMVREKRREIGRVRSGTGRSREDIETLATYRDAPEWPINDGLLVTVLSIDAISIVATLATLL